MRLSELSGAQSSSLMLQKSQEKAKSKVRSYMPWISRPQPTSYSTRPLTSYPRNETFPKSSRVSLPPNISSLQNISMQSSESQRHRSTKTTITCLRSWNRTLTHGGQRRRNTYQQRAQNRLRDHRRCYCLIPHGQKHFQA